MGLLNKMKTETALNFSAAIGPKRRIFGEEAEKKSKIGGLKP